MLGAVSHNLIVLQGSPNFILGNGYPAALFRSPRLLPLPYPAYHDYTHADVYFRRTHITLLASGALVLAQARLDQLRRPRRTDQPDARGAG